jgi:hypothetical protein
VGDVLKFNRLKNPQDIVRYLSSVEVDSVPILLNVIDGIELPENRLLLCDVLVPFAKERPDLFVEKMRLSERPQTQRDMVYVLDRSNHPEKLKFFGALLKSKNLALKLEVMGVIARGRTGEARKLIVTMLDDESMQVRLQAARVLPEFDRDKAYVDLMKLVKDKGFEDKKAEEREGLYTALGATGMPGAVAHFSSVLQTKSGLFNKQKLLADKLLAVAGLGGACTIQTAKVLQELTEDKTQPPELISAARMHLSRVRKQLFGSTSGLPAKEG